MLLEYATEEQRAPQELIFQEANELYLKICDFPYDEQTRVLKQLKELNEAHWRNETAVGVHGPLSITLNQLLVEWQETHASHEGVIEELFFLKDERLALLVDAEI